MRKFLGRVIKRFAVSSLIMSLNAFYAVPSAWSGDWVPDLNSLAYSREWLGLLHYQKRWLGGYKSRMPQGAFFMSSEGNTNPLEEMKSDIDAFRQGKEKEVGKLKAHPQCAFPLRFQWLKEKLRLNIPSVACPKVDEFENSFRAQSVSLVFSTAYPNNPGSMFGHTFFRFNTAKNSTLLNQAISYAANIGEDGGILYMIRGVVGGYNGVFSKTPYYAKVNEYNNAESRDLWEYELNLTPEETQKLVLHLWELETNSSFIYYFFDENCSFVLLAALDDLILFFYGSNSFHPIVIPS